MGGRGRRTIAAALLACAVSGCGTASREGVVVHAATPPAAVAQPGAVTDLGITVRLPVGAHVLFSPDSPKFPLTSALGDRALSVAFVGHVEVALDPYSIPRDQSLSQALTTQLNTFRAKLPSFKTGPLISLVVDAAPATGVVFQDFGRRRFHGEVMIARRIGQSELIAFIAPPSVAIPVHTILGTARWVQARTAAQTVWLFEHLVTSDETLAACQLLTPAAQRQLRAIRAHIGIGPASLNTFEHRYGHGPDQPCAVLLELYPLLGANYRFTASLLAALRAGRVRAVRSGDAWQINDLSLFGH